MTITRMNVKKLKSGSKYIFHNQSRMVVLSYFRTSVVVVAGDSGGLL